MNNPQLIHTERLIAEGRADELERLINRASHARANWRLTPGPR